MNELEKEKRKLSDSYNVRNSRQFGGQDVLGLAVPLVSVPSADSLVKPPTLAQSEHAHLTFSPFFVAYEKLFEQMVARHKSAVDGYKELLALFAEEPDTDPKDFFGPLRMYCEALQRALAKRAEVRRLTQIQHAATMPKKRNSQVIKPSFQPPSLQPASELGTIRLKHLGGTSTSQLTYSTMQLCIHRTTRVIVFRTRVPFVH